MKELTQVEGNMFFAGNEVKYIYNHHLNSVATTKIVKYGTLIRQVRDKKNLMRPTGFWMVQIKGNKGLSKIHESSLTNLTLK